MSSTHIKDVLGRIDALRRRGFRSDGSAMCMQLSGPTGSGKSMLFERYLARPDCQRTEDHVPVLRITMPTPYGEKAFLGALLEAYGAESFYQRQDPDMLHNRLGKLVSRKRTEMFLIEDFQHVVDQKESAAKIPYYAADQIKKRILDGLRVPTVFNGLLVADRIYERNKQLKLRRKYRDELKPFDWKDPLGREQFTIMVRLFARRGGFSNYESLPDSMVERVWRATNGIPGEISTLFKGAMELAVPRRMEALTLDLLAEAYATNADPEPGWRNLFMVPMRELAPDEQPDQSRVTKLTKRIARVSHSAGAV